MDLKNCYKILEIRQGASLPEIKQAYRDMIGIWHPDRYAQNPRLHEKATEKLKELNVAYNELITRLTSGKKIFREQSPFQEAPASQKSFSKKKRRFWNKWTLLLSMASIGMLIATAADIRYTLTQGFKQLSQGRYEHYFKAPSLTPPSKKNTVTPSVEILQIQQSLQQFGYDTNPLDGIWGIQTLAAVQKFRDDYFLEFRVDDVSETTRALQRQRAIIKLHPDWPRIARDRRFKLWTEQQGMTSPNTCRELLASGDIHQVGSLIDCYKFDRLQPKPVPMPRNGTLRKSYHKGLAPLTIQTRNDGRHYYLKLLSASNGSEILSAFIRGGSTFVEHVPVGKYELKYAVGDTWYGTRWLFGPKTVFRKIDQVFEFKVQSNEIVGYRLDLCLQPTGPAGAGKDYVFDF
jgi:hypothetical protein